MSGSLTVIGGHTGTPLSGLVNIPMDQTPLTLGGFQTLLTATSGAVSTGAASFTNLNIVAGTVADSVVAGNGGLYELTNTDSTGAVTAGTVGGSYTVPAGYSTLVVEAPGAETVTGTTQTGFLAVFSAQSSVNFTSDGTGTVVASDSNFIQVGGTFGPTTGWSVIGGSGGADTINTTAESTSITTQGAGNVVGLAGIFATVVAGGTGDLLAGYGGQNIVSVTGSGDAMLISGGADTVYAASGSSGLNMFFFNSGGGTLDFINQSSVSASITGGADGNSGNVTAFGGTGGGYYEGGSSGNNSLVGGIGTSSSTVIGAGTNNFLSVDGSGANDLVAGDGTSTLVAGSNTTTNIFSGGLGTDVISTSGAGNQSFFVGTTGSETLTGSSVAGALNTYYFNQASTQGGGTDVITDFRYGTDKVYINPFDTTGGAVSVQGISTIDINGQSSSAIQLTDNTTIKLVGVTFTSAQSATIIGSTHF